MNACGLTWKLSVKTVAKGVICERSGMRFVSGERTYARPRKAPELPLPNTVGLVTGGATCGVTPGFTVFDAPTGETVAPPLVGSGGGAGRAVAAG